MALQMVVSASNPGIVSDQNTLAQTLMNLSSPATATAVASANTSPTMASLSAPLSPGSVQEQVDAVPSSTGTQQFIVHHHQSRQHLMLQDYEGGHPLQIIHHLQQQQRQLQHLATTAEGSKTTGGASASPKTSPLFSAVASAAALESSLSPTKSSPFTSGSPNKFYKNKRKTYPLRSPQMEQRQTPPGVVFQFPSTFVKEGSEHLPPKLNVIFYPDTTNTATSVSPKLSTQSPPSAHRSAPGGSSVPTARARISARSKIATSKFRGLGLAETLKSRRKLRDTDETGGSDDDGDEEDTPGSYDDDQDLQGAADLAHLASERKQPKKTRKRKTSFSTAMPDDEPRPKRARVVRAPVSRRDDDDDEGELSVDDREGSPRSSGAEKLPKPAVAKASSSGKKCASCGTTNTPYWRDGWHQCTLCNACGIRFQKYRMRCPNCIYIPRKDETSDTKCRRCGHQMSSK